MGISKFKYKQFYIINEPSDGQVLSFDDDSGGLKWVDSSSVIPAHNSTSGIQGGTSNEYYHLTEEEYAELSDLRNLVYQYGL